jgi:hypothetical protein
MQVVWTNSPNKVRWGSPFYDILEDVDGTLTGSGAGSFVARGFNHNTIPGLCEVDSDWTDSSGLNSTLCKGNQAATSQDGSYSACIPLVTVTIRHRNRLGAVTPPSCHNQKCSTQTVPGHAF